MGLGRADDHPTVYFGDRFDDLDPAPGQVDPAGVRATSSPQRRPA